ncbi:MAG: hypothetical protein ACFFCV_07245 [Promethearchaeota archaeon]
MNERIRKEFLNILGNSYNEYNFPPICGWIEGLLGLERGNLTQSDIAFKLKSLLKNETAPTSISSVNRALKILEDYGGVIKEGSNKTGFKYRLYTHSDFFFLFIQRFISVNKKTLRALKKLRLIAQKENDVQLIKAISNELTYLEYMDDFFLESKQLLKELEKKHFNKQK